MSTDNLILGVNSVTVSYLVHYDSLSQNTTDIITKRNSYFITKCNRSLLQNVQVFYYKMQQFYYKMRHLLQIVTTLLQNVTVIITFITNCDSKLRLIFLLIALKTG